MNKSTNGKEEHINPRKIYIILIYFSTWDISTITFFTPFTVRSPLVDNKIYMTTDMGAVMSKLYELLILDITALYE